MALTARPLLILVTALLASSSVAAMASVRGAQLAQREAADEVRRLEREIDASSRREREAATAVAEIDTRLPLLEGERARLATTGRALEYAYESARDKQRALVGALYRGAGLSSERVLLAADPDRNPLRGARYLVAVAKAGAAGAVEDEARWRAHRKELTAAEAAVDAAYTERARWSAAGTEAAAERERAEFALVSARDALEETRAAVASATRAQADVRREQRASEMRERAEAARLAALSEEAAAAEADRLAAATADSDEEGAQRAPVEPSRDEKGDEEADGERRGGLLSRLFGSARDDGPKSEPTVAFGNLRGKLRAPARGKVLARFGQKHDSGAIYRGLIVRTGARAEVRAVAGGDVVFSGAFPGLGPTVIVAHGDRYHSVYARLGRGGRQLGDRVKSGEVVGAMDEVDTDLHFELRAEGKAFDPLPWLSGGEGAFSR